MLSQELLHFKCAACAAAKLALHTQEWRGSGSPIDYVVSANLRRRHLNASQRGMIAAELKPEYDREARERQRTSTGGSAPQLRTKSSEAAQGRSRDHVGRAVGVSGYTVMAAERVLQSANEALIAAVRSGKMTVSHAARTIEKHKVAERIQAEPEPMPTGPFRVIVIDPPWQYGTRAEDQTHRGRLTYPDMTTDAICQMPVGDAAHTDAILWLWTTNAFMRDAFQCLDAWGFQEKTILTWVKNKMGLGDWLRGKTEHCIFAVKGKPTVTLTTQTTVLQADGREHSRKPDAFYAMVEALCPGSKLEIFAREKRDGWTVWGAESGKF